jgi:hypothetical protein
MRIACASLVAATTACTALGADGRTPFLEEPSTAGGKADGIDVATWQYYDDPSTLSVRAVGVGTGGEPLGAFQLFLDDPLDPKALSLSGEGAGLTLSDDGTVIAFGQDQAPETFALVAEYLDERADAAKTDDGAAAPGAAPASCDHLFLGFEAELKRAMESCPTLALGRCTSLGYLLPVVMARYQLYLRCRGWF